MEVIKEVLSKGGDTDTNACIVGGLIGAAIGVKVIIYLLFYLENLLESSIKIIRYFIKM